MKVILTDQEKRGFRTAIEYCKKWSSEHQAELGVGEMAAGAGLILWGLHSGQILYQRHILVTRLPEMIGATAAAGAAAGPAIAATFLKSVFIGGVTGVAGVTLVPTIPLFALMSGGALIFGAFGYSATDLAAKNFAPTFGEFAADASIVVVGLALMIDGARRIITDKRVQVHAAKFKNGAIHLMSKSSETIMATWEEVSRKLYPNAEGIIAGLTTLSGTLIGTKVAAGAITVLGSHTLGSAALSLGLVSAPVWPVILCGASGLALAYPTVKFVDFVKKKGETRRFASASA